MHGTHNTWRHHIRTNLSPSGWYEYKKATRYYLSIINSTRDGSITHTACKENINFDKFLDLTQLAVAFSELSVLTIVRVKIENA